MKNILIVGGTGFLGTALSKYLLQSGYSIKILTRRSTEDFHVQWDGKNLGDWIEQLKWADVIINLSGRSVDCRYTPGNKQQIRYSRIETTHLLAKAMRLSSHPPTTWLNASSATIYMHAETIPQNEISGILGDDFSMNVCKDWEQAFFNFDSKTVRQVALRTSIVLGNEGGAFPKFKLITRLGFGGKIGRGNQMVSWLHIEDFCNMIDFIINNKTIHGPVNLTSPGPLQQSDFQKILRAKLNVPIGIDLSTAILELGAIIGRTETELLLKSRYVIPHKLLRSGYTFLYPDLHSALATLVP